MKDVLFLSHEVIHDQDKDQEFRAWFPIPPWYFGHDWCTFCINPTNHVLPWKAEWGTGAFLCGCCCGVSLCKEKVRGVRDGWDDKRGAQSMAGRCQKGRAGAGLSLAGVPLWHTWDITAVLPHSFLTCGWGWRTTQDSPPHVLELFYVR